MSREPLEPQGFEIPAPADPGLGCLGHLSSLWAFRGRLDRPPVPAELAGTRDRPLGPDLVAAGSPSPLQ